MSPTARALLALELIQNSPGITADRLGARLGVTERAARRYVAILREADIPVESAPGRLGGYRIGRGLRLPPLMFTAVEAAGLVMAVLEGHRRASDPTDLIGGALAKILRALPARVADPVRAVTAHSPAPEADAPVDPALTGRLIEACAAARPVRVDYRHGPIDADPWAVVLRHSRWYLLCFAHERQAVRVLRVDRMRAVTPLPGGFVPPYGLDALGALEDHLSQGWKFPVEVLFDAGVEVTGRWAPRSLGLLSPAADGRTLMSATTDEPEWYARKLAAIPVPFRVLGGVEIREAVRALGSRLLDVAAD